MARLNGNSAAAEKYAVLELNQVAFPRDGRIEAQLPLKKYANGTDGFNKANPAEVGMILVVDKAKGCVRKMTASDDDKAMFALNYSTEHIYDERTPQLNKYCMYPAEPGSYDYRTSFYDDFYPRMGFLAVGDRFTTDCVDVTTEQAAADDNGKWAFEADFETAVKAGTVYAYASTNGCWTLTAPETVVGPVAQVVETTTCPNGIDLALKLMIVKA